MTYELIFPLMMFALVTSITPGPNNLMLLASGANFGVRATVPHMLGVSLGHAFMVFFVGIGLAQVFAVYPVLKVALKFFAVIYMLFLAWKIANAAQPNTASGSGKPFTFLQAAAFQWINPKAWAMALTAATIYAPNPGVLAAIALAGLFCSVNLPSVSIWVVLGQQMQRVLSSPVHLRIFNVFMAVLLLGSLYPVLTAF